MAEYSVFLRLNEGDSREQTVEEILAEVDLHGRLRRFHHDFPEWEMWQISLVRGNNVYDVTLGHITMDRVKAINSDPADFGVRDWVVVGFYKGNRGRPFILARGPIPETLVSWPMEWARDLGPANHSRVVNLLSGDTVSDLSGDWEQLHESSPLWSRSTPDYLYFGGPSSEEESQIHRLDRELNLTTQTITGQILAMTLTETEMFLHEEGVLHLYSWDGNQVTWSCNLGAESFWQVYHADANILVPVVASGVLSLAVIKAVDGTLLGTVPLPHTEPGHEWPEDDHEEHRDERAIVQPHDDTRCLEVRDEALAISSRGAIQAGERWIPWAVNSDQVRAHNLDGSIAWTHGGWRNYPAIEAATDGETYIYERLSVVWANEETVLVFVCEVRWTAYETSEQVVELPQFKTHQYQTYTFIPLEEYDDYRSESNAQGAEIAGRGIVLQTADAGEWEERFNLPDKVPEAAAIYDETVEPVAVAYATIPETVSVVKFARTGIRYKYRTLSATDGSVLVDGAYLDDLIKDGTRDDASNTEYVSRRGPVSWNYTATTLPRTGTPLSGDFTTPTWESLGVDSVEDVYAFRAGMLFSGRLEYPKAPVATLYNWIADAVVNGSRDLPPQDSELDFYLAAYESNIPGLPPPYRAPGWPPEVDEPGIGYGVEDVPAYRLRFFDVSAEEFGGANVSANMVRTFGSLTGSPNTFRAQHVAIWETCTMQLWYGTGELKRLPIQVQPVPRWHPTEAAVVNGKVIFGPATRNVVELGGGYY